MQLSEIAYLDQDDLDTASIEIAAIVQSFLATTPLGALRYSAIPSKELQAWLRKGIRADLGNEARYPRIREMGAGVGDSRIGRWESLVIRDLELSSLQPSNGTEAGEVHGRIVAHAAFMYHPPKEQTENEANGHPGTNQVIDEDSNPLPASGHSELHNLWNNAVENALKTQFGGMHCFEVRELNVLAPTHWRKGIASRLLNWIIPHADQLNVPVVLAATPHGYPLYLKHGFVDIEGENGIVECDMAKWGGTGTHRHVLMIRRAVTSQSGARLP